MNSFQKVTNAIFPVLFVAVVTFILGLIVVGIRNGIRQQVEQCAIAFDMATSAQDTVIVLTASNGMCHLTIKE